MQDPQASTEKVNESRRRLTKGSLAAPIVLATLASKNALAAAPYQCTISGILSGNTSAPAQTTPCNQLGRSPGYWKNHNNWPSPCIYGAPSAGNCPNASTVGTIFNGFSIGGATFADAFKCKNGTVVDPSQANWATASAKATMLQVLKTGGGLNDTAIAALGRAAVASLLNSLEFAGDYPLKPEQVIAMFNAVYMGGVYYVNPTTPWDRDQVKTYFESLYGGL